jgi:hypothetical protein
MTAAVSNITVEQGATYRRMLAMKDGQEIPVAINITGYTFRGAIKKRPGSPVLATFTFTDDAGTDDPDDNADPTQGEIFMVLSPEQSALIPVNGSSFSDAAIYQYDVEMVDTNGNVFRIMNGSVAVSPEITT